MKVISLLISIIVAVGALVFTSLFMLKGELPSSFAPFNILAIALAMLGLVLMIVITRLWHSNPDTGIIVGVIIGMAAIQLSVLLSVFLFIANQILRAIN
jgi:membrane protease YdiL (CAAX protease family)